MTDVSLTTRLGRRQNGFITVGKTKETFCYEMWLATPRTSRRWNASSIPFFTSRNVGVKYSRITTSPTTASSSAPAGYQRLVGKGRSVRRQQ